MSSTTYWKLRRLADRAPEVAKRHAGTHPAIGEMVDPIAVTAAAYVAAYDAYVGYGGTRKKEKAEGKAAAAALLDELGKWLPLGTRDLPGFHAAEYGDSPAVPDDVIGDAARFLELAFEPRTADGAPALSWAAKAEAALQPLLDAARKEHGEAMAVDTEWQRRGGLSRETADAFDRNLQLLREALARVLGRSHLDYQRLRSAKASSAVEAPATAPADTPEPVPA